MGMGYWRIYGVMATQTAVERLSVPHVMAWELWLTLRTRFISNQLIK